MTAMLARRHLALVPILLVTAVALPLHGQDAPAEPPEAVESPGAAESAEGVGDDDAKESDGTWESSPDPAARHWQITPYLKGTVAEIRGILDAQALEFDGKLVGVLSEIAHSEQMAASETEEALAAARASPAYKAADEQAKAAKAELDAARAAGSSTEQRMAASSRYNKVKADLDRIERQAVAKTRVAKLKADAAKLRERADTFYARRAEALAWRQKLVDAILLGQTMRGKLEPGRTVGLLVGAKVERVTEDRAVVAKFPLLGSHKVVGDKEGVTQIEGRVNEVHLLVRGLDDVHKLRPRQELNVWRVFRVTGTQPLDGREVYVVEPFACDFNVLLAGITKPPALKAPPKGLPPTTAPVNESAPMPKPAKPRARR